MRFRRFLHRWYWLRLARKLNIRFIRRPILGLRGQPVIAITGTSGKTSTTLLINRIVKDAGYRTGCATTEGVLLDDEWVVTGDEAGARGLWIASRPRGVQVVVAETARGGMLRYGLGFSSCHVSVVTNVSADHLGHLGVETVEDLAEAKSMLPEHTRPDGVTVLNGDDPLVRDMARKAKARVVYVTMNEPSPHWEHCYFVRDAAIYRKHGDEIEHVVDVDDIYLGHGGAVTFQIANAMSAIAAVEGLRPWVVVPRESLVQSLASFGRDPRDVPGRMQLFRYAGASVLLSSTKNPDTYDREIPLLRRLARAHGYQRIVCVVSNVGNRDEIHFRAVSRRVASVADLVVAVPPKNEYLRGRDGAEITRYLELEVPAEKIGRVRATSLPGIIAEIQKPDSPSTLFVAFASHVASAVDVDDVIARGEPLPMRFVS